MEQKQLDEFFRRAADRSVPLFTRFLDLDGQKLAAAAANRAGAAYTLFGGCADAERRMLGAGAEAPDEAAFPISCLKITLRSSRFGGQLVHRDVLGTVMGLGIERELIGDIVVREEGAYVFCVSSMAEWLAGSLTRVGRADTDCALSDPPQGPLRELQELTVQVASPRLDAVCAHLFRLSRGDVQELIRQGRIAVDDRICEKSDRPLSGGEVLSVRGFGRARVEGSAGVSKKGKLYLRISLYV